MLTVHVTASCEHMLLLYRMMRWMGEWPAACTASSPARWTCSLLSPRCAAPGARYLPRLCCPDSCSGRQEHAAQLQGLACTRPAKLACKQCKYVPQLACHR